MRSLCGASHISRLSWWCLDCVSDRVNSDSDEQDVQSIALPRLGTRLSTARYRLCRPCPAHAALAARFVDGYGGRTAGAQDFSDAAGNRLRGGPFLAT